MCARVLLRICLCLKRIHCLGTYFFKEVFSTPRCFCFRTKPLFVPLPFLKGSLVLRSLINVSIPQRLCYMLPQPPTKQIINISFHKSSQPATWNYRMATHSSHRTGALLPLLPCDEPPQAALSPTSTGGRTHGQVSQLHEQSGADRNGSEVLAVSI